MSADSRRRIADNDLSMAASETGLPPRVIRDIALGYSIPDENIKNILSKSSIEIPIADKALEEREKPSGKFMMTPVAALKSGDRILTHDNTTVEVSGIVKSNVNYIVSTDKGPLFMENGGTLVIASTDGFMSDENDLESRFLK